MAIGLVFFEFQIFSTLHLSNYVTKCSEFDQSSHFMWLLSFVARATNRILLLQKHLAHNFGITDLHFAINSLKKFSAFHI